MSNTSATGGYLSPIGTQPIEDDALTDLFQAVISALSGIPGDLVRPRWQDEPPNLPIISQTWVAIGIAGRTQDAYAYQTHQPDTGAGHNRLARGEEFTLFCSFYGPANDAAASMVRDGLAVAQNRDALTAQNIALIRVGDRTKAPELINNRWYQRTDMPIEFRRYAVRDYPILDLLSAQGAVADANGSTVPVEAA